MSRIDDLIAELCPEGLKFKRLGDIPVYGSGGIMRRVNTFAYDLE